MRNNRNSTKFPLILCRIRDRINVSLESFINDSSNFPANSIILYKKGDNIHSNTFGKVVSYCILFMLFDESPEIKSPITTKNGIKILLEYYIDEKQKNKFLSNSFDCFLQTSVICFSDESGKIFRVLVISNGQNLSNIMSLFKFPIKSSNRKAAIYQMTRCIQENSYAINIKDNPNWLFLDDQYNSQVQKILLKEKEDKERAKQTKEKLERIAWEDRQKKIEEEHAQMLCKRNKKGLNDSQ